MSLTEQLEEAKTLLAALNAIHDDITAFKTAELQSEFATRFVAIKRNLTRFGALSGLGLGVQIRGNWR